MSNSVLMMFDLYNIPMFTEISPMGSTPNIVEPTVCLLRVSEKKLAWSIKIPKTKKWPCLGNFRPKVKNKLLYFQLRNQIDQRDV